MRAGIFGITGSTTEAAMSEGLRALGFAVEGQRASVWTEDQARPYDLVVVHGWKRDGNGAAVGPRSIGQFYAARGATVLIHDLPALRKGGYHAIWNGAINALPDTAPEDRLGMCEIRDRDSLGDVILFCGQTPNDASHDMNREQLEAYYAGAILNLQEKFPECRIVFRNHPLMRPFDFWWIESQDPEDVPWDEALDSPDLFAVASVNSTCGVAAIEAGVPILCHPMSFYRSLAGHPRPKGWRKAFFSRLSYTQWTLDEMATPAPYLFNLPSERAA